MDSAFPMDISLKILNSNSLLCTALQVYQEYISDRNHLHMNATKWLSLTGFVKWLGKEGKAIVDETEKGWFVTYIDR